MKSFILSRILAKGKVHTMSQNGQYVIQTVGVLDCEQLLLNKVTMQRYYVILSRQNSINLGMILIILLVVTI